MRPRQRNKRTNGCQIRPVAIDLQRNEADAQQRVQLNGLHHAAGEHVEDGGDRLILSEGQNDALCPLPEEEQQGRQHLGHIETAKDANIVGEPPGHEMTRVGGHEFSRVEFASVVAMMRHVPDLQDVKRAAEKDGVNASKQVIRTAVVQQLVMDRLVDEQPAHDRRIAIDEEIDRERPSCSTPRSRASAKGRPTGT